VNLQAPTQLGEQRFFDTNDLALDVSVEPDGAWHWKEDDFEEAQEVGILDARAAAWRPPRDWDPLLLPEGRHV
jgi:hypothetical protein